MRLYGGLLSKERDYSAEVAFRRRQHDRLKKLAEYFKYGGSKYPPINISPLMHERNRLQGAGMSEEDRFYRGQFLKDLELTEREPVYVRDRRPVNVLRQVYRRPWDLLFTALRPILKEPTCSYSRLIVPKVFAGYLFCCYLWYCIKYNKHTWESVRGWSILVNRRKVYEDDPDGPPDDPRDILDFGFKNRTTHRDLSTATTFTSPVNTMEYPRETLWQYVKSDARPNP